MGEHAYRLFENNRLRHCERVEARELPRYLRHTRVHGYVSFLINRLTIAPEVMCRQNHGVAVDYFAAGVMAYECMFGRVIKIPLMAAS
jgi:hypothetical protein